MRHASICENTYIAEQVINRSGVQIPPEAFFLRALMIEAREDSHSERAGVCVRASSI
jgi:hypothetical protein